MDGDEVRRRRRALGMSQAELGRRLGMPQQSIARWETGARRIGHPAMLRLALERLAMLRGDDGDGEGERPAVWTVRSFDGGDYYGDIVAVTDDETRAHDELRRLARGEAERWLWDGARMCWRSEWTLET